MSIVVNFTVNFTLVNQEVFREKKSTGKEKHQTEINSHFSHYIILKSGALYNGLLFEI